MKKLRVKSAMRFTVIDQIGRRQMKTIEDVEIADMIDEKTLFNFSDDIGPREMPRFSVRRT